MNCRITEKHSGLTTKSRPDIMAILHPEMVKRKIDAETKYYALTKRERNNILNPMEIDFTNSRSKICNGTALSKLKKSSNDSSLVVREPGCKCRAQAFPRTKRSLTHTRSLSMLQKWCTSLPQRNLKRTSVES